MLDYNKLDMVKGYIEKLKEDYLSEDERNIVRSKAMKKARAIDSFTKEEKKAIKDLASEEMDRQKVIEIHNLSAESLNELEYNYKLIEHMEIQKQKKKKTKK